MHRKKSSERHQEYPLPLPEKESLSYPACTFEAFSSHFDLPLKNAAEKFGVRATAFKKRCRTIGIRHWPYRKVRSLKRSICELKKLDDNGAMNDKQRSQFMSYLRQLHKIMSPQTYGIESGDSIVQFHDDESIVSSPEQFVYYPEKIEVFRQNLTKMEPHFKESPLPAPYLSEKTSYLSEVPKMTEIVQATKEYTTELFSTTTHEPLKHSDEFGDTFQYNGERHFLDDYIFEIPTIYDCKV